MKASIRYGCIKGGSFYRKYTQRTHKGIGDLSFKMIKWLHTSVCRIRIAILLYLNLGILHITSEITVMTPVYLFNTRKSYP